jgi:predicted transcriptional regulator
VCGVEFAARAGNAKYCDKCRKSTEQDQRRERVRRFRVKQKEKPKVFNCTVCGAVIDGGNGNSKFCSACLENRRKEKRKEKSKRTDTCRGCVDACVINNGSGVACEYLNRNGRCRPWPIVNGVCAGKCTTEREFVEWPWDTERARKLLEKGKSAEDVAAELGITKNALNNWIFRGMPNGTEKGYHKPSDSL